MKNSNTDLAYFCISNLGVPYIMGTNGKVFTGAMYNDLTRRNPSGWFTARRLPKVKAQIGKRTTDCHGLIEWFLAELAGGKWSYDTTAPRDISRRDLSVQCQLQPDDRVLVRRFSNLCRTRSRQRFHGIFDLDEAFEAAQEKDGIGSLPEQPGVCVRFSGHVGVYIGGGYVVEARGFSNLCRTRSRQRFHGIFDLRVLIPVRPWALRQLCQTNAVLKASCLHDISAADVYPDMPGKPHAHAGLFRKAPDPVFFLRSFKCFVALLRRSGEAGNASASYYTVEKEKRQ